MTDRRSATMALDELSPGHGEKLLAAFEDSRARAQRVPGSQQDMSTGALLDNPDDSQICRAFGFEAPVQRW